MEKPEPEVEDYGKEKGTKYVYMPRAKMLRNAAFGAVGTLGVAVAGGMLAYDYQYRAETEAQIESFADQNDIPVDVLTEALATSPEDRARLAELIQSNRDRIAAEEELGRQLDDFTRGNGLSADEVREILAVSPEERTRIEELIQSDRDRIASTEELARELGEFSATNNIPVGVLREVIALSPEDRENYAELVKSNEKNTQALEELTQRLGGEGFAVETLLKMPPLEREELVSFARENPDLVRQIGDGSDAIERLLAIAPEQRETLATFFTENPNTDLDELINTVQLIGNEDPEKLKKLVQIFGPDGANLINALDQDGSLKREGMLNGFKLHTSFIIGVQAHLKENRDEVLSGLLKRGEYQFELNIELEGVGTIALLFGDRTNCNINEYSTNVRTYLRHQKLHCNLYYLPSGEVRFVATRMARDANDTQNVYCPKGDNIEVSF